jgi:hypothetical protein
MTQALWPWSERSPLQWCKRQPVRGGNQIAAFFGEWHSSFQRFMDRPKY